jgi:hypothetical protein
MHCSIPCLAARHVQRAHRPRGRGWRRWAWLGAVPLLVGCGGSTSLDSTDRDAGVGPDAGPGPEPTSHRPSAVACPEPPLPPEPVVPDGGLGPGATFECQVHADCIARPKGRCIFVETNPPYDPGGTRCVYDQCESDSECLSGGVCQCGNVANECIGGNCRTDADCGARGYCSPDIDPCLGNTLGYYCHTNGDGCVDDTSCDPSTFETACVYDADAGAWSCTRPLCAA